MNFISVLVVCNVNSVGTAEYLTEAQKLTYSERQDKHFCQRSLAAVKLALEKAVSRQGKAEKVLLK